MRVFNIYYLLVISILVLLSSCQHDEPGNPIKPVDERRIMLVNGIGEIYNLNEELITTLPYCKAVSQIIVEGDDYFVAGSSSKDRVGYWKNGKWNTLHDAYNGTHELMDNGKANYLEVLTAQESLLNSQLSEAMNMYDAARAVIALYISLGGATR